MTRTAQSPDKKPPLLPAWYSAVGILLLGLFVVFNLAYRLGAGGIQIGGANTSFNREHDSELYKIDDTRAFLVHGGFVSIVKYKSGLPPFRPLCGRCDLDGSIFNMASFQKGDWFYSRYPELDGPDAYNLKTGEIVKLDVPRTQKDVDPASVPFYVEHGFTFDAALAVTPERIAREHEDLSLINESCVVFNAAFVLLFGTMVLIGVPMLIVGLRRRRSA
ncbi:hypothetical protein [Polyangium aurulentum]|uniref:hypothetical protein n=1 Tax=Polyangium aurulentum TaxID=2567896 RepID=UPI0010AE7ECC|nr:hypothetical protein [Polyangium aurulentum]UQA58834.1 hypothetical protein E8A73_047720 [Polyangium aurulentum]